MTSRKKLVKRALKHPELHTQAELSFFRMWLRKRKEAKKARKEEKKKED